MRFPALRFVLICFLTIYTAWSVAEEEELAFASGTSFELRHFELELDQCCFWGEYLPQEQFAQVARHAFKRQLERSAVDLVDSDGDVKVDVTVEYLRRFMGDETPIPARILREPALSYTIKALRGDELVFDMEAGNRSMRLASTQALGGDQQEWRDYYYALLLGSVLAKQLAGQVEGATPDKEYTLGEWVPTIETFKARFATSEIEMESYIPESVIDDYIARTESDDIDRRIRAYMEIRNGWFNSERLFDAIAQQIKRDAASQDKDVIKAVREGMNALGSSGMTRYVEVLEDIGKMEGVDSAVHKEVSDSQKILKKRRAFNGRVHDTSTMDPEQSWLVNQLANRLQIQRAGIDDDAIREVNRHYSDNVYLGGVLVDILQSEAYASEQEARSRADFHAWAARTLGDSGNADFLPVLEKLKEKATYKKVRKHANKAFKQLRKLVKKNQKKR